MTALQGNIVLQPVFAFRVAIQFVLGRGREAAMRVLFAILSVSAATHWPMRILLARQARIAPRENSSAILKKGIARPEEANLQAISHARQTQTVLLDLPAMLRVYVSPRLPVQGMQIVLQVINAQKIFA